MKSQLTEGWTVTWRFDRGSEYAAIAPAPTWIAARVPGDVRYDLVRAGILPDPLVADNGAGQTWIEDAEFVYRIVIEPGSGRDRRVIFNGIDGFGKIRIDGEPVRSVRNAFRSYVIVVPGDGHAHELTVEIEAGLAFAKRYDRSPYLAIEPAERIFLRKPQYVLGWDWAPRLVTCGLWRPVEIATVDAPHIHDLAVRSALDPRGSDAELTIDLGIEGDVASALCRVVDPDGRELDRRSIPGAVFESGRATLCVAVPAARRWYPNGYGEQPLYTVEIALHDAHHSVHDARSIRTGIRTIELDRAPDEIGERFGFEVNGLPIFARGANWVPPHHFPAEATEERYRDLLIAARDAGFTMLRVWGGGVYESELFFDLCDEYGILVWHDFIFACGEYPEDHAWFVDEVRAEAIEFCRRVGSRTSLALLCGNNENHWIYGFYERGDRGEPKPFAGQRICDIELPAIVAEHTPGVAYWPGSPYGGRFPNDDERGDKHAWAVSIQHPDIRARADVANYRDERSGFVSEYGLLSTAMPATIRDFSAIDVGAERPTDAAFRFHDNTFNRNVLDGCDMIDYYLDAAYGEVPEEYDEYVWKSLFYQAYGYRAAVAAHRTSPRCRGSLLWMYSDCWGTHGWTLIDFYGRRKPSWYAIRRAYRPIVGFVDVYDKRARSVIVNDTADRLVLDAELEIAADDPRKCFIVRSRHEVAPFSKVDGPVAYDAFGLAELRLRASDGSIVAVDTMLTHHPRVLCSCEPRYRTEWRQTRDGGVLSILAETNIHCLIIEESPGVILDDNYLTMIAGSRREIRCRGDSTAPPPTRALASR